MEERVVTAGATNETRPNRPGRDDFRIKENWGNTVSSVWPDELPRFQHRPENHFTSTRVVVLLINCTRRLGHRLSESDGEL